MAVTIDTLKAATRLREEGGLRRAAGDRPGSDVRRRIRRENLATKDDVEHLRGDVEHLRGDVEKLERSLRGEMGKMALRTDLEKTEAKLMGEMSKLSQRLTVRFGGAVGAAVGILVALDKLF